MLRLHCNNSVNPLPRKVISVGSKLGGVGSRSAREVRSLALAWRVARALWATLYPCGSTPVEALFRRLPLESSHRRHRRAGGIEFASARTWPTDGFLMPKVLQSSEGVVCVAKISLASGKVVCLSIAQGRVLVRLGDAAAGLFKQILRSFSGATLYDENDVNRNGRTAQALTIMYPQQATELKFDNPLLAAFSNAIWHCKSVDEIRTVLNESAGKIHDLQRVAPKPDIQRAADVARNCRRILESK
jgi:hypothetical protein